ALAPWRKEAVTAAQWRRPLAPWRSFQLRIQFPDVHLAPCAAPLRQLRMAQLTGIKSSFSSFDCAMRSLSAPWRRPQG
ncbi:hypothetical protein L195_g060396, partial [Trifolium pratense]